MQQSKQSVILYHLHPWEHKNEGGRGVEGEEEGKRTFRGGIGTWDIEMGDRMERGRQKSETSGRVRRRKWRDTLKRGTGSKYFFPAWALWETIDRSKKGNKEREQVET
ncbi:unnamed protein product [Pleuronectes platessa]|uniref:Uncharacterized protein n=1 Tax=Pleuronectes platessa TaxID=8262 RepID=A0A9N7U1R3_PLEPL|nr:unnamed protein product [Pleuronectes platessa]